MSRKERHNDVTSISDLMKIVIQENNLTKGLRQVKIEEIWKKQMGNGVASYTEKVVLRSTTLTVFLTSSVLREELSYGKDKIIKLLNESIGEELVKRLVLL
jgi:phosphopantetheine adenylyltransferase